MTNQDKKAYLNRYKQIDNEISQLILEREEIMSYATKITPTYSDMPQGSGSGNKIQSVVERLEQQEVKINHKIDLLISIKEDIERALHTVEDNTLRMLLRYRYINRWTFERIAVEMHYSWRQVIRLHGMALDVIVCHTQPMI